MGLSGIRRGLYLCCYDVQSDEQRNRVHRIVASFAIGGQKSAYECYLSPGERHTLENLVKNGLSESDSLVIQPIVDAKLIKVIGIGRQPSYRSFTLLG